MRKNIAIFVEMQNNMKIRKIIGAVVAAGMTMFALAAAMFTSGGCAGTAADRGLSRGAAARGEHKVVSPDGEITVEFSICEDGKAHYAVSAYGQEVIGISALGLEAEEAELTDGFAVKKVRRNKVDEEWTQPWGENKQMRDRHNEMAVHMENSQGVKLTLRFRAFDDGVGYRYEYDASALTDSLTIIGDNTYFNFAKDGTSWSIASYFSGYELPYREQKISETENANTP